MAVDELHLMLRIPTDLPAEHVEAIRRALAASDFLDRMRQGVCAVLQEFPALNAVRVAVTR